MKEIREKKVYKLKHLDDGNRKITKDKLLRILKEGADLIRTVVDYKVLILILFLKAVSDKYIKKVGESGGGEESYIIANTEILVLYDEKENKLYTWNKLTKDLSIFINGVYKIIDLNKDRLGELNKLIERTGLNSLFDNEEYRHIVEKLIDLFGKHDFSSVSYDILGDAYEWILNYFAPTKAKEGEVYTPIEVSKLLANIVKPEDGEIVLDPACGSGSMLIEQYLYCKNKGGEVLLTGQERNEVTAVLAKLNLILHGINLYNAQIYIGDSLINPKFETFLKEWVGGKADKVVANPPWNLDGYNEETLKKNNKWQEIYKYGFPPKQSADWAWVQLISYYTTKKAGIILDQGALFRGGREKAIREKFIKEDVIEAIILLPEKIFYNVTAPGIILILNKDKSKERKGKILFINASEEFIKHPEVRKLNKLSDENIQKIAKAYEEFKDIPGFSRVVNLEEIKKRDYNLNVPLYIEVEKEEEKIDLKEISKNLDKLHKEYLEMFKIIKGYLEDINKIM